MAVTYDVPAQPLDAYVVPWDDVTESEPLPLRLTWPPSSALPPITMLLPLPKVSDPITTALPLTLSAPGVRLPCQNTASPFTASVTLLARVLCVHRKS